MTRKEFEKLIEEEFVRAVPDRFHHLIKNVGFLVEQEPSEEDRREHGLGAGETLLGLYKGIPHTARGGHYGIGETMPDTITLYQQPIEEEAAALRDAQQLRNATKSEFIGISYEGCVRRVVRETIWHEVAHYFGYDEEQVQGREERRDSAGGVL